MINFSVWETIDDLKNYVYKSAHAEVMRHRRQWFEKFEAPYMALWWIPAGHIPTVTEAKGMLEYLEQHGVTARVFTFREPYGPPDNAVPELIVGPFETCPAT